jgi:hypothetical protein
MKRYFLKLAVVAVGLAAAGTAMAGPPPKSGGQAGSHSRGGIRLNNVANGTNNSVQLPGGSGGRVRLDNVANGTGNTVKIGGGP